MSNEAIGYKDTIKVMQDKITLLSKNLTEIKGSFKEWQGNKPSLSTQQIYNELDCNDISSSLEKMISSLNNILNNESRKPTHKEIYDAKSIMITAYQAVLAPTQKNLNILHNRGEKLSGESNNWAKLGLILIGMAGFLCAIIPGLMILSELKESWKNHSQKGMSLIDQNIKDTIRSTAGAAKVRHCSMFKPQQLILDPNATIGENLTANVTSN